MPRTASACTRTSPHFVMFAIVKTAFHCENADMKTELSVVDCHVAGACGIFTQS